MGNERLKMGDNGRNLKGLIVKVVSVGRGYGERDVVIVVTEIWMV